ncbi:MAG TPA: methyltransferase domain-containing protein [Syntrophales bacterium]|nr:methyltransferase domain-containing protein [Syntrophales bacterium]
MLTIEFDRIGVRPGEVILDAGCGTGRHLVEALVSRGARVVGIDRSAGDLAKAAENLAAFNGDGNGRWLLAKADIGRLPFPDGTFDAVVCSEVLEHLTDGREAVAELVRVLKTGRDLAVSVPRYWPERLCWAISEDYHREPGGHVRIWRKGELQDLLRQAGASCRQVRYRHALHAPYWWLRCLVGHKNERALAVRVYRKFLEWDILAKPRSVALLDRLLNPLLGKSIVFYLRKGN